jgi:dipeptidase E
MEGGRMADDLLLLSNSVMHGMRPLAHAMEAVTAFLDGCRTVYFVPYALADHARYTAGIAAALAPFGVTVVGLHETEPREAVESADVLFVGGGNSFRLLRALQQFGLIEPVRRRVAGGSLRYMGSSAGTNMACPSLRTTNDMPIVQPESFAAFALIPFQINPHYLDPDPASTHGGETREQRIDEFLEENDVPILGLREGTWLRRRDRQLHLHGQTSARLFRRGMEPEEIAAGADLSSLLDAATRFDTPM